jgi:hypothetical protein
MAKVTVVLMAFCLSIAAAAQTGDSNSQPAKDSKDQITARGCVSRQNSDFILTQVERGNSYELHGSGKVRLSRYLGQQVEVTGTQAPSLSTSSDTLARGGSASPVTITVSSIKTIAKRCSD